MARKTNSTLKKPDLIKMIVDWVIGGTPQMEIINNIKALGYEISYAYMLLRDAKPIWQEALKDLAVNRLEATIANLEQMKLDAGEDRRLQLEIQKEINKISGLHVIKTDITTNGDSINNITIIKLIEKTNE